MDDQATIRSSARRFLSGTLLSRIAGLGREIGTAALFGASASVASFFVAYRMAQLFRRLLGEGAMLAGFTPFFEEARSRSVEEAARFFRDLFFSLLTLVVVVLVVLEIALFAWRELSSWSSEGLETITLVMIMLPGVLFISFYALFSALLQTEKKYFLSGFAPVCFNLVLIAALLGIRTLPQDAAIRYLSVGVVVAFLAQWVVVIPSVWGWVKRFLPSRERWRFTLFSPELRRMIQAMAFTLIGISAVQINTALDALFARYASLSGPAHLYYAMRLYQFPLSLFGIALSAAILPPLARAARAGDAQQLLGFVRYGLSRSLALMAPATGAILVLGLSAAHLLFGWGHFDEAAAQASTSALWLYGLGLVPAVFVLILSPVFYAYQDYKTPLKASLWSVLCNTVLNGLFVFVFGWDHNSIALATTLSGFLNASILMRAVRLRLGSFLGFQEVFKWGRVIGASVVAAAIALWVGREFVGDNSLNVMLGSNAQLPLAFKEKIQQFGLVFCIWVFSLLVCSWLFRAREILTLFRKN